MRQTLGDLGQLSLGSRAVSPLPYPVVEAAAHQLRSERGDLDPTGQWEACQGRPVGEALGGGLLVVVEKQSARCSAQPREKELTGSSGGLRFINANAAA